MLRLNLQQKLEEPNECVYGFFISPFTVGMDVNII